MIKKIRNLKKIITRSNERKILASNFSYLLLLQIAGYIFPLFTIPYLARVIGVEGFGKIAFAAAVIVWFQTIVDWGFNYTATRDVARNKDDLNKVSQIFSNVFWTKIFLALISLILLIIAITTVPYLKENQLLLMITYLLIPGKILFADWFFQAIEKMRYITLLDLISKAFFTAFIFIFIHEQQDYILQPLIMSLGYFLVGLVSFYLIIFKWKVKLCLPHWLEIKKTIKSSADVFLNNIMPNLYNSFSSILLGLWGGSTANGLLDAGSKFSNIAQQFTNIISRVFFPFLSRSSDKYNIYAKINIIVSIFASITLFFFAPIIIKIFFIPEFYQSIIVLQIMSLSIVFLSLNSTYGLNYMVINGYEKSLRNITIINSIIGFLMAFPLIYFYGFIGAAITITVTRGILGLSVMLRAKSIHRSNIVI